MISVLIAPPTAPQLGEVHELKVAGIEHPLAGEVLNAVRQHGTTPVQMWRLINSLAVAPRPDYRARLRCYRLRYWGAIRELLRAKLLWRHGHLICRKDFAPQPKPRSRRRGPSANKNGQTLLSPGVGASKAEEPGSIPFEKPDQAAAKSTQGLETQVVGKIHKPPTTPLDPKSAVPTATEVSAAARTLAARPRKAKRWTGWLHGKRIWRLRPVVTPDGRTLPAYVVRRNMVFVALLGTSKYKGRFFERYRAADVRIAKDPNAVLLGRLKAGRKERPSPLKQETARRNGRHKTMKMIDESKR